MSSPLSVEKTNSEVNISHETTTMLVKKLILTRNDDEISASPRNIYDIYDTL